MTCHNCGSAQHTRCTDERKYDVVGNIVAYEQGELEFSEVCTLFQHLVSTGTIQHLQGSYQRAAQGLLDDGFIHLPGIFEDISCVTTEHSG